MTQVFKKFIAIILLLATGTGYSALTCPTGYTTDTTTVNDIMYTVCYPNVIYLDANGGEFTIYASVYNGGSNTDVGVFLYRFIPIGVTIVSSTCTVNPNTSTPTLCGADITPPSGIPGTGNGEINYAENNELPAGTTVTVTAVLKVTSTGSYSCTPQAYDGTDSASLQPIILNVQTTCPTVTASNATGPTGCSDGVASGSLVSFVTGGQAPYTFAATGTAVDGTISITTEGTYSFTPNVAGPTTGSFSYQAFDTYGCPSNAASVSVPIIPGPSAGSPILYTTAYGTPVTGTLNFSGGTPPYTIQTVENINGFPISYNGTQFTFTQIDPGASFFTYSVTDANGCGFSESGKILIYSCEPGNEVSASLDIANSLIYSLCTPSTVSLNNPFQIVASISNPDPVNSFGSSVFADLIPDSSQPSAAGLSYQSNNGVPANTLFITTGSQLHEGGKGTLTVTASGGVGPSTDYSITMNILPTMTGLWGYTAAIVSNPNLALPFLGINVVACNPYTAANTGISSCNNAVAGNLSSLVTGGSGPYSFFETGTPSCGQVSIATNGSFLYTAPVGYTGPCTFEYYALDSNTCPSSTGVVTVTATGGPIAGNGSNATCENVSFVGTLSASGGALPYTFSVVTNGTLGTATITNPTTGAFTYVPNANVFGSDFFTFHVIDANGCISNLATYAIVIHQSPIASSTGIGECASNPISGSLSSLVSAGTPPYSFASTGPLVGGTATVSSAGLYTFTPAAGFSGLGSFGYEVTDSQGCNAAGIIDVSVGSLDAISTSLSTCLSGTSGSLQSLVSGGLLPYTFTGPLSLSCSGSAVTISPSGLYTYIAPSGFTGPCNFVYGVTDAAACSSTGAVTITANSPLAAGDGTLSACANIAVSSSLADYITPGAIPPLTFTIITAPTHGTLTVFNPTTGVFTYTPTTGFLGADSFMYQVSDSSGCVSNVGTITINVITCCVITAAFPALVQQLYFNIPPV